MLTSAISQSPQPFHIAFVEPRMVLMSFLFIYLFTSSSLPGRSKLLMFHVPILRNVNLAWVLPGNDVGGSATLPTGHHTEPYVGPVDDVT